LGDSLWGPRFGGLALGASLWGTRFSLIIALFDPGIGYNACKNLECLGPLVWSSKKLSQIIVLIYDLYSRYVIYLESIDFQVLLL
jgi:hypothetical protein